MLNRNVFSISRSRSTPYIFLILLAFTLGNVFYSVVNIQSLKDNGGLVDHTNQVLTTLEVIHVKLLRAFASERLYVITGDASGISEYKSDKTLTYQYILKLSNLVRDNKPQTIRSKELKEDVDQTFAQTEEVIALRSSGDEEGADQLISSKVPSEKINQATGLIKMMENVENDLLKQRVLNENLAYERLYIAVITAGVLNILLIALAYYLIKRELDKRIELEERKNQFINIASHELKTPLTSLKIYLQILERDLKKTAKPKTVSHISKMEEQINRLIKLVGDLLDVSRIQTNKLRLEKSYFDLNGMIEDVMDILKRTTTKHAMQFASTLSVPVYADRYRVYQVIINLLTNAIKYSPKGGKISVKVQKKDNEALVSVKDEGIGLAKENIRYIFDPLYQVRGQANTPGLGMGLFIAAEVVRRHSGKIWVESKGGYGSTFFFTLPLGISEKD